MDLRTRKDLSFRLLVRGMQEDAQAIGALQQALGREQIARVTAIQTAIEAQATYHNFRALARDLEVQAFGYRLIAAGFQAMVIVDYHSAGSLGETFLESCTNSEVSHLMFCGGLLGLFAGATWVDQQLAGGIQDEDLARSQRELEEILALLCLGVTSYDNPRAILNINTISNSLPVSWPDEFDRAIKVYARPERLGEVNPEVVDRRQTWFADLAKGFYVRFMQHPSSFTRPTETPPGIPALLSAVLKPIVYVRFGHLDLIDQLKLVATTSR